MATETIHLNIDWPEYGWKCPLCGGDVDHSTEDRYPELGYTDDVYTCQERGGELCEYASFMVRWSLVRKGENGDALTLAHWIEIEVDKRYMTDPDKASAKEAGLAYERLGKQFKKRFDAAVDLLEDAQKRLDLEGVLSDDFKAQLHWVRSQAENS